MVRMAQARSRFGDLCDVWKGSAIGLKLKISLYSGAVCSMLVHGGEAWLLNKVLIRKLRGWNARCLVIITGRGHREETVEPTFDLVSHLRSRRLRWLGHILRMPEDRLLRRVVTQQSAPYREGSLFMDAPPHSSMVELVSLAYDRRCWNAMVRRLKRTGVSDYFGI